MQNLVRQQTAIRAEPARGPDRAGETWIAGQSGLGTFI
jgi:hypothetical protein